MVPQAPNRLDSRTANVPIRIPQQWRKPIIHFPFGMATDQKRCSRLGLRQILYHMGSTEGLHLR